MASKFENNWASLLGEDPRLPPDVHFRVTEELSVGGTKVERTEMMGAHKFVLSMASDVFKDQFCHQIQEVEVLLTGVSIEAFREFLKILYSLFFSKLKVFAIKAEYWSEILILCKKYEVEDAVSFVTAFKSNEGCIKQELLTVSNVRKFKEEIDGKERIETDGYCILCREYGHFISEECISSTICFGCGLKGCISRDSSKVKVELKNYKCEDIKSESAECKEEYVEMEIEEDDLKAEVALDYENYASNVGAQERMETQSLKKCSVNLPKITIQQASRISHVNSNEKWVNKSKIKIARKNYCCDKCTFKTSHIGYLWKHLRAQHEDASYPCEKCDYTATCETNLSYHIQTVHEDAGFACGKCNFRAKSKITLLKHFQAQHGGVRYSCDKCDLKVKYKMDLIEHINSVHESVKYDGKYELKSKEKSLVSQHMNPSNEAVIYSCEKCVFKTNVKWNLKIHVQAQHEGVVYFCRKCNYKTKFQTHLSHHMKVEHDGFRYACEKCDYKAKQDIHLKLHIQAVHEGIRYFCEKCNFETKYKQCLTNHMKAEHEDIRYFCEKCTFETKYKCSLTMHMQAQHEDNGYFCGKCSFKTKYKGYLIKHKKRNRCLRNIRKLSQSTNPNKLKKK